MLAYYMRPVLHSSISSITSKPTTTVQPKTLNHIKVITKLNNNYTQPVDVMLFVIPDIQMLLCCASFTLVSPGLVFVGYGIATSRLGQFVLPRSSNCQALREQTHSSTRFSLHSRIIRSNGLD